jgi:hypothetical protein
MIYSKLTQEWLRKCAYDETMLFSNNMSENGAAEIIVSLYFTLYYSSKSIGNDIF